MIQYADWLKKTSLVLMFSSCVGYASAQSCMQGNARYLDPESGLVLAFSSFGEGAQAMHHFSIGVDGIDTKLDGFVIADGDPLRPKAMVVHDCPDGDVTGDELAECLVWEGIPYGLYSVNAIGLLPSADDEAVTQLLLPDFAQSAMSSDVWKNFKIENEPFEVFDFKDCGAN